MALLIAALSIIVTLFCFNRQLKTKNLIIIDDETKISPFWGVPVLGNVCMYVLGTLLNQGDACS